MLLSDNILHSWQTKMFVNVNIKTLSNIRQHVLQKYLPKNAAHLKHITAIFKI